ncbi:glycosyltransferase involved in cell wall biosynthesis [Mucilaginibacter yixingensis]|uniref:Glycosyltransferase involved in cell wall biosynthesis n=1 Tax=Mucilaginibacter yixingensis TaxID=1295612 RepID=A0A2T5JFU1_9SPHI|nr:DUF1972 domain-containing protein [Mucilaginibacter yixingensis]PTR01300.1 glycosyltransferase involved in cell wall biosynthesis [Mucilaginibacter yixingensis]
MKRKKIAIIGTAGIPAKYTGFETLAAHIVDNLGKNWDFTVYCSSKQYGRKARKFNGARLVYLPFKADGVQSFFYDLVSIFHALFYADVLFIMGVSSAFIIPFIRLFTNKKVITSVDGFEWKRNNYTKLSVAYRRAAEWVAKKCAHINIENNESMQDVAALRHYLLGKGHVPDVVRNKYSFINERYAFGFCRIAPENNVEMILQSFVLAPHHQLVLVGNWQKSEYGRSLRKVFSSYSNIHMLDAIRNQQELDMLARNSFAYIHGNVPGGLDPVLLEAMFSGLPVLAMKTPNNMEVTEGNALYFDSAIALSVLLNHTTVGEFQYIGQVMKETVQRRYTWALVATKYEVLFNRVTEKPHSVTPVEKKRPINLLRFNAVFNH